MKNIKELISKMTLEEKLCQLTQVNAGIICAESEAELKDYKKIALAAGEEKKVAFKITEEMLKFWMAFMKD